MIESRLETGEESASAEDSSYSKIGAKARHALDNPIRLNIYFHLMKVCRPRDVSNDSSELVLCTAFDFEANEPSQIGPEQRPRRARIHYRVESR